MTKTDLDTTGTRREKLRPTWTLQGPEGETTQ